MCAEAGAIFQSWLLTANDQRLIMPRKTQFLNGLSEGPQRSPEEALLGELGNALRDP